jgi:hypothetical protein
VTRQAASAPKPCPACGDAVRQVVDANNGAEYFIDAAQVGAAVGNVVVVQVAPPLGVWLVEVHDTPGPPGPAERWELNVPPPLWAMHVCPLVPVTWRAATEQLVEEEALPA